VREVKQEIPIMRDRRLLGVLALLLVALVLMFFHRLADRDLWSSHEARAAMDAQSLLDPDHVGLPQLFDGIAEMQKPPLYYFMIAAVSRLTGKVDAFEVRFPSAMSAALVVALVVLFAWRRYQRPVVGLLAGLILASSPHFPWLARIGRIDMPLTLAISVSAICFATRRPLLGWLACAFAVLLKGPIGLALIVAIVGMMYLCEWRLPPWRELRPIGGLMIFAAVVVPVFAYLDHVSQGQFTSQFLWFHTVQRGLGGSRLREHPFWLYLPYLGLYLLPYSLLFLAIRRKHWEDPLARFAFAWLLGVVVLLSLARFKRADYLVPAYPAAALLLACVLEQMQRRGVIVGMACVVACMFAGWAYHLEQQLPASEPSKEFRTFALEVRQVAPVPKPLIFFRVEAHALAFRTGRPLVSVLEWHDLRSHLSQAGDHFLIVSPAILAETQEVVREHRFEVLLGNAMQRPHERPLLLVRVRTSVP
jgi:4-amino-4-deoxy-L-arabinose transferase-like glycosyltransferase